MVVIVRRRASDASASERDKNDSSSERCSVTDGNLRASRAIRERNDDDDAPAR